MSLNAYLHAILIFNCFEWQERRINKKTEGRGHPSRGRVEIFSSCPIWVRSLTVALIYILVLHQSTWSHVII